jgi:hypothetical protein
MAKTEPEVDRDLDSMTKEDLLEQIITSARTNAALRKEVLHWKANHDNRVDAAHMLIERIDMPLERVGAYRSFLSAQLRIVHLSEELDKERDKRVFGQNTDLILFRVKLEEYARAMCKRYYPEELPNWEPLDTAEGLLSQIDNMVSGLSRLESQPAGYLCYSDACDEEQTHVFERAEFRPYRESDDAMPVEGFKRTEVVYRQKR